MHELPTERTALCTRSHIGFEARPMRAAAHLLAGGDILTHPERAEFSPRPGIGADLADDDGGGKAFAARIHQRNAEGEEIRDRAKGAGMLRVVQKSCGRTEIAAGAFHRAAEALQ